MNYRLFLSICFLVWTGTVNSQVEFMEKFDQSILELFDSEKSIEAIILLKGPKVNFKPIESWNKHSKATYVFNTLVYNSQNKQQNLLNWLRKNSIEHESFFIVNAIHVRTSPDFLIEISKSNDVLKIAANTNIETLGMIEPNRLAYRNPNAVEWGLEKINADKVWEMGITGEGAVVGGQDTGVNWEHSTLSAKYRGESGGMGEIDHNYNWFDAITEISPLHMDPIITEDTNPCGLQSGTPCDDAGHGSWTMGIMVGSNESDQIGVAPGANWIACRCMERGYGSLMTYIDCLQWFLAPTDLNGENPDPSKAPDVINNSWGCPEMEGCPPSTFQLLEEAIGNLVQSGVVVVASAGNEGRAGCGTILEPPGILENVFVVGSTKPSDKITDFSSRGPVEVDGSFRMKPDMVAPGENIRSSGLGQTFYSTDGTSGSSPYVAGTVALMISANPELAGRVSTIHEILKETAIPLQAEMDCGNIIGNNIPNHTYGYGRLDAQAAVLASLDFSTATKNITDQSEKIISIFPNPFTNYFQVDFNVKEKILSFAIWDIEGKKILNRPMNVELEKFPLHINTAHLSKGMYFYQLVGENWIRTGKLLKM